MLYTLLENLDINPGDVVYLHTSFKYMSYLGLTGELFLETIVDRLGTSGTLVLPSFAWHLDPAQRPWKGYKDYFETRPVFDVVHTAANIGWIPELFRQMPGVKRSLNYWWSICAKGPLADELTSGQEHILYYYGPGSSYDLLRVRDVKILGLGVSLNTTSLALIPDHVLGDRHTQQVFTAEPQVGIVIDYSGKPIETRGYWLLPEVVRCIKPSAVMERSPRLRDAIRREDVGGTIQFAYPYQIYHEEALRLGEQACAEGRRVPWLEEYPLK